MGACMAPRRDGIEASIPGANSRLFVDRPDFFDYPDSDQASLAAVAQFIGEKPVTFVRTVLHARELPERGLRSRTGALDPAVCHTSTTSSVEDKKRRCLRPS
nr:fertilization-influencing membrane protein isoform X4 [Peromyscus maniculatus bairdii]